MNQPDLRTVFFERGAEAWKRFTGTECEVYICPVCEQEFTRNAILNRVLSLEHVPPKSIGGTEITLTCKSCNNTAGYEVDAEVHHRNQFRQLGHMMFQKKPGIFKIPAKLDINDKILNTQLDVVDGKFTISVLEKINNPAKFYEQIKYLKNLQGAEKTQKLKLIPKVKFHIWRSQVSDLRSAYLAGFAGFGYTWAMSTMLDPIREQILNPERRIVNNAWFPCPQEFSDKNFIIGLQNPVLGLAVFIKIAVVLLPWFSSPPDFYSIIGRYFSPERTLVLKGQTLGWPQHMEMQADFSQ